MKLYFERHDGQAVTCDDFAQSDGRRQPGLQPGATVLLPQFKRWYSQAGTPRILPPTG
jgi:aminopeptidase N